MDIFYQELSYEEIEQNIAFEFLSLLSEIGGFLGLLLGASILTVCELIDYSVLAFMTKFAKKVEPTNIKQQKLILILEFFNLHKILLTFKRYITII